MEIENLTYVETIHSIISSQIIRCNNCGNKLHDNKRRYTKDTPVALITGKIGRIRLRRLQAERGYVDRLNYKYWEKAVNDRVIYQEKYYDGKVPDETYDELLKFVRKQIWKAICYIDEKGKRHDITHKEGVFGYPHKIQNANSNIIKYCGDSKSVWNLCPNRFGYITRPDVLEKVFSHDHVTFLSNNMGKLKHYQVMSYEVNR